MKILLLSAYHSASHRYWCEGLMAAFPDHDWTLRTQPARHFSWRVRASGWLWALDDDPAFEQRYDLVIATSLTNLVTLKACCPALQGVPVWVYCHENQFAHPLSDRQQAQHQIGWQFLSIQNALCADWISFNTAFNRDTFLAGARKLLKRFPEKLPGRPMDRIERASDVLPVPLTDDLLELRDEPKEADLIVWNHRWEWDKQPGRLLAALVKLKDEGVPFRLAMLGSGGGRDGDFAAQREALGDAVVAWGEAPAADYRGWLARAGIGVSTSLHDFQGLSMLELAQAGATVVAPRRQAYPECLPDAVFFTGDERDPETDSTQLAATLADLLKQTRPPQRHRPPPTWAELTQAYRQRIEALTGGSNHGK